MSDYPYPSDEFDQPPAEGQSVGIHRAPRSTWSKVWPFLAVVVGFGLLALAIVWWLASQGDGGSDESTTSPPAATATEETPAEDPTEETPAEEPTEETPAEEPTEEPTDETPAELDRSVAIRVLNATQTAGLAAQGVEALVDAGWTDATGDNYTGTPINASVVWYQSDEYAAQAEQVAADLGIARAELVPSLRGPISVILTADFG
ncbi:MAG: LytR C-terminal domain-containing protein [Cellulomonadaceae bacterium]